MPAVTINKLACRIYGSLFLCAAAMLVIGGGGYINIGLKGTRAAGIDQKDWETSFVHLGIAVYAAGVIAAIVGVLAFRRNVWAMIVGTVLLALVLGERIVNHGFMLVENIIIVTSIAVFVLLTIIAVVSRPLAAAS
jgi:hypothetical protein